MKKLFIFAIVMALTTLFTACQKQVDATLQSTDFQVLSSVPVTVLEPTDCGQLRTQSQGGWGANPEGNNPGTYLHANFAAAFPNGLRVGCNEGFSITYTSAQAITDFLPAGGAASSLYENTEDPVSKSIRNVLAAQVTALTLNVIFDSYDTNFAPAPGALGEMIVATGPFSGKTVNEFLAIANQILGGCSSAYPAPHVAAAAEMINQNYIDGTANGGALTCADPNIR